MPQILIRLANFYYLESLIVLGHIENSKKKSTLKTLHQCFQRTKKNVLKATVQTQFTAVTQ